MAAVALLCLAVVPYTAPNAPGVAIAAEKDEAPTESETGDPAKDAPAPSEASESGGEETPGDEAAQSDADESEEIFVPSEDISEDIDVPFPVDI